MDPIVDFAWRKDPKALEATAQFTDLEITSIAGAMTVRCYNVQNYLLLCANLPCNLWLQSKSAWRNAEWLLAWKNSKLRNVGR